ncbi:MAG: HNH endonuclease [Bacteroidales bacterium]|nr:HNH endonuclease [Bacteroidales bacterium]
MIEKFTQEQLEDIINIFETNSTKKAAPPLHRRYGISFVESKILYAELVQEGLARDHLRDRWTIEQTKKLKYLVEQGYNISEIADIFTRDNDAIKGKDAIKRRIIKEFGCVPIIELPGEEWRESLTFKGYQVSNKGRVRDDESTKVYKGSFSATGYPVFNSIPIHRLVAEVFIPNPDNKPYVDHIDTDKTNNDVTNLRWVTQEENMRNEQTRENLRKGREKMRKIKEATALIEQAFELVPDKLELIQLVIQTELKGSE